MVNIKQNYPTISQSGSGGRVIIIISPSFRRRVPFGWAESRVFLPSLFRTLKSKNKNKNKTWDPGVKHRDDDGRLRLEIRYMALEDRIGNCDTASKPWMTAAGKFESSPR